MKNLVSRISLMLLLLAVGFGTSAMAQYRGHRPSRPATHRHYHSRTDNILRGLDAVETAADYAMLGSMLHHIDDYTGFRLGFNNASLRVADFDARAESITGFDMGFVFGWYLGRRHIVSIEPGLYYSMKGGRINYDMPSISYDSYGRNSKASSFKVSDKITMHSFELPVVFKAHLPLGPTSSLQPFAGTFASFGFAGTTTFDDGEKYDTFDDGVFEDFDAGLRFGIGLSLGQLYLEAVHDRGLLNLDNNFYDANLHSKTWSFNVGINF